MTNLVFSADVQAFLYCWAHQCVPLFLRMFQGTRLLKCSSCPCCFFDGFALVYPAWRWSLSLALTAPLQLHLVPWKAVLHSKDPLFPNLSSSLVFDLNWIEFKLKLKPVSLHFKPTFIIFCSSNLTKNTVLDQYFIMVLVSSVLVPLLNYPQLQNSAISICSWFCTIFIILLVVLPSGYFSI